MNTRLVLWGEIGTDRKALIAIHLEEQTAKIHIHAFPKEEVTKEVQDALFTDWKNGGEYTFPETAIHWEVDANSDTILPEEVKVDRLDIVLQSQHKWGKKLMSTRINQLLTDEVKLLEEKAAVLADYDATLWEKAKAQWDKIASYHKKNEITWEQTTVLKDKINAVFDALKAVRRLNSENEDHANAVLLKNYHKRIEDLQAKLIYSDQWKHITEELKKIQAELKDLNTIRWNHKKALYNTINDIFDGLRKYRMTEIISKTKGRIDQLSKILGGLKDSIARDQDSYKLQVEKMQHYTRGKLPEEEIKSRFSYLLDTIKEKETKIEGIQQTIAQLKKEIEKEKKQQDSREEQKQKKEAELEQKKQDKKQQKEQKAAAPAETVTEEAVLPETGEEPSAADGTPQPEPAEAQTTPEVTPEPESEPVAENTESKPEPEV
jgi:hypothetical protein